VAEELALDLVIRDRGASDSLKKAGDAADTAGLKVDQANLRVERSSLAAAAATRKYGASSLEAREATVRLAAAQNTARTAADRHASAEADLRRELERTGQAAEDAGDGLQDLQGAVAAVSIGAAAGAAAALNKALDIEAGVDKLQGQLGATAEEAERYGQLAGELYSGAYGDSLDDVNDAIKNVSQNVGKLGDTGASSLENITGAALTLKDTFDVDLFESTRAAGALLRNGLAKDAGEAFDLITVGLQRIPTAGDDLLDTLSEYSVQFAALGLSGPQALAFIESAMKGGARSTDLAADALKEFNLRAKDTTNVGAQQAIEELGLSGRRTAEAIAGGGSSATAAMADLLTRLRDIENPADRARLATQLLGTQAEDLQAALFAVNPQEFVRGLQGVDGAAAQLSETVGDNGKAKIESYRRELELLVAEAAGMDGPLGTGAAATAAFGGSALTGAASLAQFAGGLALIPGVSSRVGSALGAARRSAGAFLGAIGRAGPAIAGYVALSTTLELIKPSAEDSAVAVGKLQLALDQLQRTGSAGSGLGSFGDEFADIGKQLRDLSDPGLVGRIEDVSFAVGGVLQLGGSSEGRYERQQAVADFKNLDAALAGLVSSGKSDEAAAQFQELNRRAVEGGAGVDQLARHLPTYTDAVAAAGAASGGAITQVSDLARGITSQGDAAATAAKSQAELNESMTEYTNQILGLRGSQRDFEAAIDSASEAVKDNGKTLDITTAKGRSNAEALDAIAKTGLELANQTPKGADAQKHFASTLSTTRRRLIDAAEKMGSTREQAKRLADRILGIPSSKRITVRSNVDAQAGKVRGLRSVLHNIGGQSYSYTIKQILVSEDRRDAAMARRAPGHATGGPVLGPGTGTSDSIVRRLSNNEHIWTAAEVAAAGGHAQVEAMRRAVLAGGQGGGVGAQGAGTAPVGLGGGRPSRAAPVVLELRSSGSRLDDVLLEILRGAVRVRGGDVQLVLGR
jgi:phage-related minor tail protein